MKTIRNNRFFTRHAKSSAMMISIMIHALLLVVAISLVAVTVIKKEETVFEANRVSRPKMQLRKLKVPVKFKKKRQTRPKLRKRIIANPMVKSVDLVMPETAGMIGGMGNQDDDIGGLDDIGFNFDLSNIFGKDKGSGNELEGTFFDLKVEADGSPAKMDEHYYDEVIKDFIRSWNLKTFNRYFKAPKKKFAISFMLPRMDADEAPKAYAVDDVVKPKQWVAYYSGKIAAPKSGKYRFWGIGDDILMVRIKGKTVLDANLKKNYSDWRSNDPNNRKFKIFGKGMAIGDWFTMSAGRPINMEVLVGERPGGVFYCHLLIEEEGVDYPKGPGGYPILPIFKTTTIPEKLTDKMGISADTCTLEGPCFGVLHNVNK